MIYYNRSPILSLDETYNLYPTKQFESPARSTIPLLSLLKDGNELMQEILLKLGISTEYNVHLEYNIHSSQTDAMIISSNIANAIEVKWTEPKEKTVGYYKQTYHYSDSVFQYWIDLLNDVCRTNLTVKELDDTSYQMLHRAASSCALGKSPILTYLQFNPLPNGTRTETLFRKFHLKNLWNQLGRPSGFPFYHIEVIFRFNDAYYAIKNLKKGDPATAGLVISHMRKEKLFVFEDFNIVEIR
jgi:hypothetical protein